MSRSRRKHPVRGWGGDDSDREFKRIWHKRMRAMNRVRYHKPDPDLALLPDDREAGDVWCSLKEAKMFFDAREHPEWMRK